MQAHLRLLNRILLLFFAVRATNLFLFNITRHASQMTEARLVKRTCDEHGHMITGAIIDCNGARRIVATRSLAVSYAVEHTLRTLFLDTWRGAASELASLAQLLGLVMTLLFTGAYLVHSLYEKAHSIKYARRTYGDVRWTGHLPALPVSSDSKFD